MSQCIYSAECRDGKTLDFLTNEKDGIQIAVAREGGELISLQRRDAAGVWQGFLHRDNLTAKPDVGWANHATLMGYYLHRIKDEQTEYLGRPVRGSTHSFLRHKTLAVNGVKDHALRYAIFPEQIASEEYPFRVALELSYTLVGDTVRVGFAFQNYENHTAHVSFGLHPGFACASLDDGEVLLPAGTYVRHFAPGNFLSGETQTLEHAGGPMPFAKADLPGSYLLEPVDVPMPLYVFSDKTSGRVVELNFAGVPYVTLWSDGNTASPFICVEPCWGLPDHHEQRAFENKLGMQTIPPLGTLERSFTMSPRFAR